MNIFHFFATLTVIDIKFLYYITLLVMKYFSSIYSFIRAVYYEHFMYRYIYFTMSFKSYLFCFTSFNY